MFAAGVGRLVQVGFLLVVLSYALDRFLRLPVPARAALLGVFAFLLLWQAVRQVVRPLTRPLEDVDLAIELERRLPVHRDVLASAVSLGGDSAGGSPSLRAVAVRQAEDAARRIEVRSLVNWTGPLRSVVVALALLALLAAVGLFRPARASLWLRRNVLLAEEPWPRRTRLQLTGFPDAVRYVPRGADVEVSALAEGVVPDVARLRLRPVAGGEQRTLTMERRPPREFAVSLKEVTESAVLQATAGDGVTAEVRLEAVPRPEVDAARIVVRPPAYISSERVELSWNAPEFAIPAGSRVDIELTATVPVAEGQWSIDGGQVQQMELVGERKSRCSFTVGKGVECEFVLVGEHGIRMEPPLRATFRAMPDEAPEVRLTAPGVGGLLVPSARLPLRVVARDDYAASEGRLELSTGDNEADPVRLSLWQEHEGPVRRSEYVLDLRERAYEPGDRLRLTAVVRDNREPGGPNVGRSIPLEFRIVRLAELLRNLLVQQEDLRRDLEQHIQTEKALLNRLRGTGLTGRDRAAVEREQNNLATELTKVADAYRDVLEQLRNNRVLEPEAYRARVAEIVTPLEELAAPDGAVARAAETVRTSVEQGRTHASDAVRGMETVRENMLLMEGTAAVAASVIEIGDQQRSVLERTGEGAQDVLDWLEGDE